MGGESAGLNRAFLIGILLNIAFVAVEAFYGWKADSLALLADAGHNLSDVVGLVLAWGGILAGRLKPDARHTYGWKRGTILAAFANSLILLVAMGSLAWEAVGKLANPPPAAGGTIMIVAAMGVLVNSVTALLFFRRGDHDLNIRGAFLHMAADALVSVGVVVAGGLALWKGWNRLDPLASLVIVAVILFSTWGLFRRSLHMLLDGVPFEIDPGTIRKFLESLPGVSEVHDLHIWATSTSQTALTAHLVVPLGHPGDTFLQDAFQALRDTHKIEHPTLQIEHKRQNACCGDY